MLTAARRASAVLALVAGPVARHQSAALGAGRSVGRRQRERQVLLRLLLRLVQLRRLTRLDGKRVLRTQELRAHPAEDVVHDRLRVGNLLIPRPARRLEPHMAELVDEEL